MVLMVKPTATEESPQLTKLLLKTFIITLLIVFSFMIVSVVAVAIFANFQLNSFTKAAGISREQLFSTVRTGLTQTPTQTNGRKNVLLLGVDSLETRGNALPLTDTMMLVSINLKKSTITTLPIPRDLWHPEYKTKINALYTYGLDRYPENPARFPTEVLSKMTGVPIHHTIVLSMNRVAELIDLMGGITIDVPIGFEDTQFPRPDVDVTTERDPAKLYQTVRFQPGTQQMDGQTALAYIRSRHGNNDQNTDEARASRQQLVIAALMDKVSNPKVVLNPQLLGKLYAFYAQAFAPAMSVEEVIATGKKLLSTKDKPVFQSRALTVYPDDPNGIITHPNPRQYQGLWVYTVTNQEQFQQYVKQQLDLL